MLKRLVLALCASVLAVCGFGIDSGSSQEAFSVQVNALDLSDFPEVRATVTVVDATHRPIAGLPMEAFKAQVGDRPVPVTSLSSATDAGLGVGVVLTFDSSGSMAGAPIEQARAAGKALAAELGANDQVSVVAFSDDVRKVLDFTRDSAAVTGAIDGLDALGNTALYQAVAESGQIATSSELERRAVIFLSDGVDFGGVSTLDAETSLSSVEQLGVPYFIVGLGDLIDQAYLEQLATRSRGQLLLAPTPGTLVSLYQNLGEVLRHQYVVTLDGTELESGSESLLRMEVLSGGSTGIAETEINVPGSAPTRAPEPTRTRAPTAIATAAPTPGAGQPESGGSSLAPLFVALVVGGVATSGMTGYLVWRRQRRLDQPAPKFETLRDPDAPLSFPTIETTVHAKSTAYLQMSSVDGPQTYPLGDWPITVGFTSDCSLRLLEVATPSSERVRIWRREGRYMLHNLSRMGAVLVSGKPVTWAILEDGDEVQVGQVRLLFRHREDDAEPE
jgi:Mg-chelatase subunit ChlD